jgi:hypothetical protein
MNKIIKNTLIALLLGICSANLWARNFRIEVIVFQQNSPTSETFPQVSTELSWPNIIQQDFRDNLSLQRIYSSLAANYAYQPMWYKSWVQSFASHRTSGAMSITQGDGDLLNGFIRVQRGHYVQLLLDLEYSPGGSNEESQVIYRINEKRRVKLNEIHYFDHPRFGVIATVRPL